MISINEKALRLFERHLREGEKAGATVAKYLRDVEEFGRWLGDRMLSKTEVLSYKEELCRRYAPNSVNAAIAALNCFFSFTKRYELRVKSLRIQRQVFAEPNIGRVPCIGTSPPPCCLL